MNPLTNTSERILAAINYSITDLFFEISFIHSRVTYQRLIYPFLIRIRQCVQLSDSFFFLCLCGHGKGRKEILVETVKCRTDPGKLILRDESGSYGCCSPINRGIPYGCAATPSSKNGTLFKIELICCENFAADMFRYERS